MAHIDMPSLRVTENSVDSPDPKMSVLSALCKELVPPHGLGTTLSLIFPAQKKGKGAHGLKCKGSPAHITLRKHRGHVLCFTPCVAYPAKNHLPP